MVIIPTDKLIGIGLVSALVLVGASVLRRIRSGTGADEAAAERFRQSRRHPDTAAGPAAFMNQASDAAVETLPRDMDAVSPRAQNAPATPGVGKDI